MNNRNSEQHFWFPLGRNWVGEGIHGPGADSFTGPFSKADIVFFNITASSLLLFCTLKDEPFSSGEVST